jgi:LPS export ABC transporter protein LptC
MLRAAIAIAIASLLWLSCSTPGDGVRPTASGSPAALSSPPASPGASSISGGSGKPVRLQKTVIKTKQGQRWEMEADQVDWMDNNSQAKAQQVTWFLLNPQGQRTVKVKSPGADVDMKAQIVTFTGNVVAQKMNSEESLVVQRLVYNGKEKIFHGSEGVLWKRKGFELAGQTLTATAELDKVQLKGRVKGKTEGGLLKQESSPTSGQRDR